MKEKHPETADNHEENQLIFEEKLHLFWVLALIGWSSADEWMKWKMGECLSVQKKSPKKGRGHRPTWGSDFLSVFLVFRSRAPFLENRMRWHLIDYWKKQAHHSKRRNSRFEAMDQLPCLAWGFMPRGKPMQFFLGEFSPFELRPMSQCFWND